MTHLKRDTFCKLPFMAVKQGLYNEIRPCCRYTPNPSLPKLNQTETLTNVLESGFKSIQDRMLRNEFLPECYRCYQEEDNGKESLRQFSNRKFKDCNELSYVELAFSNECNLKCRMCNSSLSNKWIEDEKALGLNPNSLSIHNLERFFPEIVKCKEIKIVGGEPFISKQFFEFLQFCKNYDMSNTTLNIYSNGTFYPKKYLDVLSNFKSFVLRLSIDGIGLVNDYIRSGNWNTVDRVVKQWRDSELNNLDKGIHITYQAYNAHDLKNIDSYAKSNGYNVSITGLTGPEYLSVKVLPKEYKDKLIKEYQTADINDKDYIISMLKDHNGLFNKFKNYTFNLDKVRNQNIKEYIPELGTLL